MMLHSMVLGRLNFVEIPVVGLWYVNWIERGRIAIS